MPKRKNTASFLDDPGTKSQAKEYTSKTEIKPASKKKPGPKKLYVGDDLVTLSCKIKKETKKKLNRALANSDVFESQGQIVEIALRKFLNQSN